ncbi:hypothetical protein GCM10018785_31720 [Streptomyces longispororuber]|uniref:Uncharacterized protein n=1 Tax=Streptomyces longispororuber TaxID=68230 RepID=A0A918ZMC8_9ACTN|nr:hypothetical protein [Streptomyces longispororuber]GHE60292.1 hypothetical protein GCM10018785_31720 [Streptomyces longispororuber]
MSRYEKTTGDTGDTGDTGAAARHARFGALPERIRFEDMTEGVETGPNAGGAVPYRSEGSWKYYSCLALDLGL